jgi:hypothetical protein
MPFINIDITSVRFICQVHFLFPFPYFLNYAKIILLWQFQMFYQKASAWGKTRELPEPEII